MVGLLALAHDRSCEAELATALETTLAAGEVPDLAALRERFGPTAATPPAVSVALPAIATYDALLGAEPVGAAA
jgi:plasmid stability protein